MFLQLWAVQACTVSSVEGQGLALRGPDGSMDKAVRHMARQSRATYAMFSLGIMLIKASTLIFIINSFSVFVSVPTALLCAIIAPHRRVSTRTSFLLLRQLMLQGPAKSPPGAARLLPEGP